MDVAVVGVVALLFVLATPGICKTLPFKNKYAVAVSYAIVFTAVYYAFCELILKRNEGFALLQSNMSDPICPEGMTFNKELGKCVEEIYAFDPTCPEGTTLNNQRGGCVEEVYTNLSAPNNSGKGCEEDAYEENACEEDACEASPSCSQGKVYLKNSNKCANGTGTDTLINPICPEGYIFSKDNNKCMRPMNIKNGGTTGSTSGSTSGSNRASTSGSTIASNKASTSGSTPGSTAGSTPGSTAGSTLASNKASTPGSTPGSTIASNKASTMASTVASTIAAAPYWDILNAPNMTANTWNEMNQVCADKGQRLCSSKDLCPSGQPIADMNIFGGSDNWMAVNDVQNEWVTYNKADGRLCKTHTQLAGGEPGWGDSNSSEYSFYRAAKCCPKPPTIASTIAPTIRSTIRPTIAPTIRPTIAPTIMPTIMPASASTIAPAIMPATASTMAPTIMPTTASTIAPAVAAPAVAAPAAAPAVAAPAAAPAAAPVVAPAAAGPTLPWDVLNKPNTTHNKWSDMNKVCTDKGQRLCSSKDLCPSGQPIADMNKEFGESDNWMAVNDTPNEWLTYNTFGGRICKTHTQVAGAVPGWGETTTGGNYYRAAKCCPGTAAAPAAAPIAAPAAAVAASTSVTLQRGQIVGNVNNPTGNYTLSFTITIRGIIGIWGNIIQVSRGRNEDRAPAIFVTPGKSTLHIVFGDETDANWRIDETDPLPIGQPVNVSISANGSDVSATVGSKTYTLKQPKRRPTGNNFTIYMSDPWTSSPANAAIDNIKYVVDGVNVPIYNKGLVMYGAAIGRGATVGRDVPVQAVKQLTTGENVYLITDDGYVKMVTESGIPKYFSGTDVNQFDPTKWNSYNQAGVGSYMVKPA